MRNLKAPKVDTLEVTTVKVTGFINNREELRCEIQYMTSLSDGTPYQRGNITIDGTEEYDAFAAEMDEELEGGLGYEKTLAANLYKKVLAIL
jgi:hypothetical protein